MVECKDTKVLIDCGMFQGPREIKERNYNDFPFNPKDLDFVILTHAHIDHSGLLPKLVKHGYKGKIYCTTATKDLCSILLPDSGHIQEMEVERKNRKLSRAGQPLLEPIYTVDDAYEALKHFEGILMYNETDLTKDIKFNFINSGHILGSAIVELFIDGKKIVFTGDLGNQNQPIIHDPDIIDKADYLIIESTYGSRTHGEPYDKEEKLKEIIRETFARGGNLIIPAFAVARTQDLLYHLYHVTEDPEFKNVDIYIDSPLAIEATKIFCRRTEYYDDETDAMLRFEKECPLIFENIKFTKTAEESIALNSIKQKAIIISASGMADAGRIKHHLKHNLWREESTVLFIGYQAMGTLGRRIVDGEKTVRIHGEEVSVEAKIVRLDGFSAHADSIGVINWLKKIKEFPKEVFVVHGEEESAKDMASLIKDEFNSKVYIPQMLETFDLLPEAAVVSKGGKTVTAEDVNKLYAEIISLLDKKVNTGLNRNEHTRLLEKLYNLKVNVEKI
jgi:metallo-beta-lactamase family protein